MPSLEVAIQHQLTFVAGGRDESLSFLLSLTAGDFSDKLEGWGGECAVWCSSVTRGLRGGQASQLTSTVICNVTEAQLRPSRIKFEPAAWIEEANCQAVFIKQRPDRGWDLEIRLCPESRALVFWGRWLWNLQVSKMRGD